MIIILISFYHYFKVLSKKDLKEMDFEYWIPPSCTDPEIDKKVHDVLFTDSNHEISYDLFEEKDVDEEFNI